MTIRRRLDRCYSIEDLQQLARRRLPRPIFEYLIGGAETEVTARRNTAAFDDVRLIPRMLVDVGSVNTATRVLGQDLEWPVCCSPCGAQRFYHPDGELAVARAAARSGTLYGVAVAATASLEDVATADPGPKLFQLLPFKDQGLTQELIERCRQAGYKALCLTVDATVRGNRERELRYGMGGRLKLSPRSGARFALRPRWFLGQARRGPLAMPNIGGRAGSTSLMAHARYLGEQGSASLTWQEAGRMVERWGGPFAVKGILSAEDARRAADIGATAVIVSNHGGRQLDGAVSPIDVLPEIVAAVGDRVEVILDGGIRRGAQVLKALACGAKACCIGRAYLFGLAAGGEAGVGRAFEILRTELVRAMQLSGCTDVRQVDRDLVRMPGGRTV